MPTCFSKDECDVMDSGNYKFGANQRNSLLMSQLSCFLSTHVSLLRFFYTGSWSMETVFLSRALHSNHLENHLHQRSPHFIPPHCWQSCASTIHTFFIEPTKNISSWWIDSLLPSSPSKTRCARLLGICSQKKHTHHPRPRYAIRAASTHSRPQLTNGVP